MSLRAKLNILFLTGILVVFTNPKIHAQGIQMFEGSWDELRAQAKLQHKPFFIDCYTSWCGPCKLMASRTFTDKSVGDYYNANFLCYSKDMEKGEGVGIAKQYHIGVYPSIIYFNADGEMIHRTAGFLGADIFINEGKTALDPQNNFVGRIKRLDNGEKDTTFLLELINMSRYADDHVMERAINTYWKQIPESQLSSKANWERFKVFDNNISSVEYKYVEKHKDLFIGKYGEDEVNKNLMQKAAYCMQHAAETNNEALMKQAKEILDNSKQADIIKFAAQAEMMYYKSTNDIKTFRKLIRKYVETFAKDNADELNSMAFEAAAGFNDDELLKDAEKWSAESIKIKKTYANMDMYAHILYKMGKTAESEKTAQEALEIAQKENTDPKQTQELLNKIKSDKEGK